MASTGKQPCDEGLTKAGGAGVPRDRAAAPWILAATILGSSMVFIDGTVVNVALPALQKELGATVVDVQWVVESYALLLAALLLAGGSLGDIFGRRLIFCMGVGVFALASVWCGLAPDVRQLIVARAAQGVGGALLVPGSLAIISASFDDERRGRAIGTWSGFTAITTALGPVLGGWLIEHVSWRAVFFINVPLACAVLLLSFWRVPESRAGKDGATLDWKGTVLATLGLGGVVYGLVESSRLGFGHWSVVAALAGGAVLLALFLVTEARVPHPMLPLKLFRSTDFSGANLLTLLLYTSLGGVFFFLPLNLIQVQGYSATAAGAATLPLILIMFLLSRWSGGLLEGYGARLPLTVGPLVAAFGFALFALPGVGGSYWTTFFPAVVVLGFGMAVSVAPLTTAVMSSVPKSRAGVASGINNAVSRAAGLLGIACFGILMLQVFDGAVGRRLRALDLPPEAQRAMDGQRASLAGAETPPGLSPETQTALERAVADSFVSGFRVCMLAAAVLALLGALSAAFMIRGKTTAEAAARAPAPA